MAVYILVAIIAYAIGSVNFSIIFLITHTTRAVVKNDIIYGINIIIACNMPSIIALFIISPIFTKSQSPLFL